MANNEKRISSVKDNYEKQATYREQLGKYKRALNNEFYFEAILIVYAMMEDRMRSYLYYIGAVRRADDLKLNVNQTKSTLRTLYFGSEAAAKGKQIDLKQISVKEKIIRSTLTWAMEFEGIPKSPYLAVLKKEYEGCIDMDGLLSTLNEIERWRSYRNEIIHGLLNKNVGSVSSDLRNQVECGMAYTRFLDNQIKALKKKDAIRKAMRIKR